MSYKSYVCLLFKHIYFLNCSLDFNPKMNLLPTTFINKYNLTKRQTVSIYICCITLKNILSF